MQNQSAPIEHEHPSIPRRHLVYDEAEQFGKASFRIRLWRGKDATPIALVSQVKGGVHPRGYVTPVANFINEALLQYPDAGFLYFEDSVAFGAQYLVQFSFDYFGHANRLRLFKPEFRPKAWDFLEHVLGGTIER